MTVLLDPSPKPPLTQPLGHVSDDLGDHVGGFLGYPTQPQGQRPGRVGLEPSRTVMQSYFEWNSYRPLCILCVHAI